ncbi:MAG: nicotinamide-nucleotide amidase [Wenzhouxiangellaceae bacterium]
MDDWNYLRRQLATTLRKRDWVVCTAESCTGGWIAKTLTDLAGSSVWFDRGFVTYSNAAKHDALGVDQALLDTHGAVSEAVARAMAEGALRRSAATVGLAVTGIAGPGGGSAEKPVGLVHFALARHSAATRAGCWRFNGDREAVRRATVASALRLLLHSAMVVD